MKKIMRLVFFVLMVVCISYSAFASATHELSHAIDHHECSHNHEAIDVENTDDAHTHQEHHTHNCCHASVLFIFAQTQTKHLFSIKDVYEVAKNEILSSLKLDTLERPPLS